MAISLEKKKPISLTKAKPGLKRIVAGLGWDEVSVGGKAIDCDVSVFMLGANGKLPDDEFFVFYNNTRSPEGAVFHSGDSRTGAGDGDDESVEVDLGRIDSRVDFLYFTVTIHEAAERGHHFGYIMNSYIRLLNQDDGSVLAEFKLNEAFDGKDSLLIAMISRNSGEWSVEALGEAFSGGLETLIGMYQ